MRTRTAVRLLIVVVLILALLTGVAVAATKRVKIRKSGSEWHFSPSTLTIKRGTTVRWKWSGKVPHNVTGRGFSSATDTRLTFRHRFKKAGTYRVVCTIHEGLGQKMTIKVR